MAEVSFRDLDSLGYPGYRVGDDGSVWGNWIGCRWGRRRGRRWKQLRPAINSKGYPSVNLTPPGGRYKTLRVHRLVLLAFVGPCPEGMECRHLNGIKTDNRLANLCWGTLRDNVEDNLRLAVYHHGEGHSCARLTEADVRAIRARYATGGVLLRHLAEEYGVKLTTVHAIVQRRSWKHVD